MSRTVQLLILCLVVVSSSSAFAKETPRVRFEAGAGASMPLGTLGSGWGLGFHGRGALSVRLGSFGHTAETNMLAELEYHSFEYDSRGSSISGLTFSSMMLGGGIRHTFFSAKSSFEGVATERGIGFLVTATSGLTTIDISRTNFVSFQAESEWYISFGFGVVMSRSVTVLMRYVTIPIEDTNIDYIPLTISFSF